MREKTGSVGNHEAQSINKDRTMKDINVDELYVPPSSVFSNEQKLNFNTMLKASLELLQELCLKSPIQFKKIVYLSEDILKVAKSIPSAANHDHVVDMSVQLSSSIHQLAAFASRIEIGMPVNIDKQLKVIQGSYSEY